MIDPSKVRAVMGDDSPTEFAYKLSHHTKKPVSPSSIRDWLEQRCQPSSDAEDGLVLLSGNSRDWLHFPVERVTRQTSKKAGARA